MNYPNYKVCLRCFTFNQSEYIVDTLNGFVMQQTDFPYVCCIVDDASTDGEPEVIRKYVSDNFDLSDGSCHFESETDYAFITYAQHMSNKNCYFAVLYLKENHYSIKKPKMPYLSEWRDKCEYEAICEGDDYWIEPKKIQLQYEYMANNTNCALTYTQAKGFSVEQNKFLGLKASPYSSFEELLLNNSIPTLTVMYRLKPYNEYYHEINPSVRGWRMGDYPIWLYLASKYKIHYLPIVTAVYRYTSGSASHPTNVDKRIEFDKSARDIRLFFAERNHCDEVIVININHLYSCEVINTCLSMKAPGKALSLLLQPNLLPLKEKVIYFMRIVKASLKLLINV